MRALLCLLGYHAEFLDQYRVWDQSENVRPTGPMRVKTIRREWECLFCGLRSTDAEREHRLFKQEWAIRVITGVAAIVILTIVGVL